ncbi:hypothetical protein G4B88_022210 [Cannabis sativa]|uniref:DUF4283 domain-containing protein n=1 Tax=Cannabis sativa TaxID=3483 RepID=A0A7J6FXU0_CANSA|nr:hypothetical protein G4B88_022210 [Cannabis sativa]
MGIYLRNGLICVWTKKKDTEAIFDEEDGDETEPDLDDRWCLIGRLLTSKVSDFLVFQNIMADLWKPGKGIVINGSPWTYDRKQLIIERLKPGGNPKNVMLNTLDMWVQIHDLQSGFRTEKAVLEAGRFIGEYLEADPNNFTGVWREYFRVRAPNRRQNFLTASPWLRSGKTATQTSNEVPADEAININSPSQFAPESKNKSHHMESDRDISVNEGTVVILKESGVKFSSDLEFEISEGKRKRMDSLFNGPINNNSGPVESKWVGRPSTDRCLKLGNSRYWQVGSCWELEILPFFIVHLREVLINHTITDELKLGRLPLNKKTPRQL